MGISVTLGGLSQVSILKSQFHVNGIANESVLVKLKDHL